MQMPDKESLPEGPHRDFVELLFDYYRLARRPTLEKICNQVRSKDRAGTASRETIRRMLRGVTVPPNWQTVEVVFIALCELAGVAHDVKVKVYSDPEDGWIVTDRRSQMEEVWHAAFDGTSRRPEFLGLNFRTAEPVGASGGFGGGGGFGGVPASDPWARGGGISDDPPF